MVLETLLAVLAGAIGVVDAIGSAVGGVIGGVGDVVVSAGRCYWWCCWRRYCQCW